MIFIQAPASFFTARLAATMSNPPNATSRLRSLVENGVAKRFDLSAWARDATCAHATTALERLEVVLEQIRPDVVKLIVMESLEGTREADLDTMVYGETKAKDFLSFLDDTAGLVRPRGGCSSSTEDKDAAKSSLTFYDLGSGAGKSVVTAALSSRFVACHGIELLPCAHAIAECVVEDFHACVAPRDDGFTPATTCRLGDIFIDDTWIDADYVFCNCVTWDEATMERLARAAEAMRPGAVFVTVLCPLPSEKFELARETEIEFSWGRVEALVHRKL